MIDRCDPFLWGEKKKIAVVIVYYEKEVGLLRLMARSLVRYFDRHILSKVVFINNSSDVAAGKEIFSQYIVPELQDLRDISICVSYDDLGVPGGKDFDGYSAQQALKLEAVKYIEDPFYLVLDAKNHLIKDVNVSNLFDTDGRPRSYWSPYSGYLLTCLKRSFKFVGATVPEDCIAYPTVTPNMLITDMVRGLKDYVGEKHGLSLYEAIRQDDKRTEFLMYSAWLQRCGGIGRFYSMGKKHYATLFTRWPEDSEDVWRVLRSTKFPEVYSFGVHARRYAQLTVAQVAWISEFWAENDLFESAEEAQAFIFHAARNFPGEALLESQKADEPLNDRELASQVDVLMGRNGRLFILNGSNEVIRQHQNQRPLSETEVQRWVAMVEDRVERSKVFGAKYAMLVAPDTHAVYREDVPELDSVGYDRPISQILSAGVNKDHFCYPLEALRKAREKGNVCHSADSHWSGYGAYVAYSEFVASVAFDLKLVADAEVSISEREGEGDLGSKLTPAVLGAYTECVVKKPSSFCVWNNGISNRGYMAYWRGANANLPRGLLFMDSYGWKLQRFVAESFSELFVVHTPYFEEEAVEAWRPDIIISEMAERFVAKVPDAMNYIPALSSAQQKDPDARYPSLDELRAM